NNFFGMGNETVYDDDIEDAPGVNADESIHYYRYRFEEMWINPTLSRNMGRWGTVKFGPLLQRVEMEEPRDGQSRFIEVYSNTLPSSLFNEFNTFAGGGWQYDVGRRNDTL